MKKHLAIAVGAAVLMSSAYTFAATAGPSLTKSLDLMVKNRPSLVVDWAPVVGLSTAAVKSPTVIGSLNITPKFVKSITIKSTNAADAALNGNVTFEKVGGGGSFKTTLSSGSDVVVTNATGAVTIAAKANGSDLPTTVPVSFTTVESKTDVVPGDYSATVNVTSVVL